MLRITELRIICLLGPQLNSKLFAVPGLDRGWMVMTTFGVNV